MNTKRWIVGSLIVWVAMFLLEYLFHGLWLMTEYESIANLTRAEADMETFFVWILLAELIVAFGFCYIFTKGYEGKGIIEGVRYGLAIGLTFGVGGAIMDYAVFPYPESLVVKWCIGYPIEMMILGAVFACYYKPKPARPV